jgi:hypothetical protein
MRVIKCGGFCNFLTVAICVGLIVSRAAAASSSAGLAASSFSSATALLPFSKKFRVADLIPHRNQSIANTHCNLVDYSLGFVLYFLDLLFDLFSGLLLNCHVFEYFFGLGIGNGQIFFLDCQLFAQFID